MPTPTATAEADPNALAARALDAIGAQRDMPGFTARHGWSWGTWLVGHGRWHATTLLIAIAFICTGLLGAAIWRARARRAVAWQENVPVTQGPGGTVSPHLERAEAYARDGRFAEALHELLLQALADIRGLPGTALAPSLTSREILRQAKLGEVPSATLRLLIGRVEWTYFGLRAAESSDYQAGRADLDQLRQSLNPA